MTVKNSRRTTHRVYRIGLVVSGAWLVVTTWWACVVVRALLWIDVDAPLWQQSDVFDRYENYIVSGAVIGCVLFVVRFIMFLQWPDARLLWRSWRR